MNIEVHVYDLNYMYAVCCLFVQKLKLFINYYTLQDRELKAEVKFAGVFRYINLQTAEVCKYGTILAPRFAPV